MLEELNLKQKLLAITADNVNSTLITSLYNKLSVDYEYDDEIDLDFGHLKPVMRFGGMKSYIRCLAHILNLIVKDILKELKSGTMAEAKAQFFESSNQQNGQLSAESAVAKLRLVVLYIARSPQRRQHWKDLAEKFVQYDVDTRWNSTYDMIHDALKLKLQLIQYIKDEPELEQLILLPQDWELLKQLCDVLKSFSEYTKALSEGRPTITTAFGVYFELSDLLKSVTLRTGQWASYHQSITTAVQAGLVKFEKYWSLLDNQLIYYIAAVLDPRIKGLWLQKKLQNGDAIVAKVRQFLCSKYKLPDSAQTVESEASEFAKTKTSTQLRMLREVQSNTISKANDIDRYFDLPVVNWDGGDDPDWLIRWWRNNSTEFPLMSLVARDYLAIQAAEVDVERVFCMGRDLIGLRRYSMGGETMRVLMLLQAQYRASNVI